MMTDDPATPALSANVPPTHEQSSAAKDTNPHLAIQELVYALSHDLNEPLRAVLGFSELMLREDAATRLDDSQKRRYLQHIQDAGRVMQRRLDALLEYSRIYTRKLVLNAQVDMHAAAQQAWADLQEHPNAPDARFELSSFPPARGDADLLRRALGILLHNALTYSPTPAQISLRAVGHAGETEYLVIDQGIGVPQPSLERIFEPFVRCVAVPEDSADVLPALEECGVGMGLPLVQRIALRHGGRVWASSPTSRGTTVHLRLPTAEINEADKTDRRETSGSSVPPQPPL